MRDQQHEDDRHEVRNAAQQAGDGDTARGTLLDDGRQPEHEAVVADAPEEVLDAEPDDAGVAEGRLHVGDLREEPLFALELLAELGAGVFAHPCGVCRFVANDDEPDESPEDCGQAFDDEGHLPAEGADEIAGCGGHPDDGDWIAEEEERVGAGALGAGEPVGEQDQHCRQDEALGGAKKEAVECEQPEVANDAGERGKNAPADESEEDQAAGASAACVGRAGDLEEEVSKEEESAEERRAGAADVEGLGESCCSAEAVVGSVEVGEAVGDEDDRQNVEPALAHLGLRPNCAMKRFVRPDSA